MSPQVAPVTNQTGMDAAAPRVTKAGCIERLSEVFALLPRPSPELKEVAAPRAPRRGVLSPVPNEPIVRVNVLLMVVESHESGHIVTSTRHSFPSRHRWPKQSLVLGALGLALCAGGCQNIASLAPSAAVAPQPKPTPKTEAEWRAEAEKLASRYHEKPNDAAVALAYAQALRGSGQRTQAVSVLQQASYYHPTNTEILGAYGRALSDVGNLEQALQILNSAHTPDQPDWRILSAQGAVLDQLGRHDEAQAHYASALKIKPDDPGVLSNLGLSYALAKDLNKAEETLRRAASRGGDDPRVRQNLALVVGLEGRFGEAESIARADLPADEAAANVATLRRMLAQQNDFKGIPPRPKLASVAGT
jgi:Flp pilus assembly protein TadD